MGKAREIAPEEAVVRIDEALLPFADTGELEALEGLLGQERAEDAIRFALRVGRPDWNVFVNGSPGTGRSTLAPLLAREVAASMPVPDDICYVYRFDDPARPQALRLPAGEGRRFKRRVKRYVEAMERSVPAALRARDVQRRRQEIIHEAMDERTEALDRVQEKARAVGLTIEDDMEMVHVVPLSEEGGPMQVEDYDRLSVEKKKGLDEAERTLREDLLEFADLGRRLQERVQKAVDKLHRQTVEKALAPGMKKLREAFRGQEAVLAWLEQVREDLLETWVNEAEREEGDALAERLGGRGPAEERYTVHLVVDHAETEGGPVVVEAHPTWGNLIGRVERRIAFGALETDHTLIRAGSLLRANGGILVLDAHTLLTAPLSWYALKRALRERCCHIEEPDELGPVSVATLRPEPVALDLRIVLIGTLEDYLLLREYDEEFGRFFKVRADFDDELPLGEGCGLPFGRLVASMAAEQRTRAVDRSGVAALMEQGSRMAEDREAVSLHLVGLSDLLVEAELCAADAGHATIGRADVARALEVRQRRSGLYPERMRRSFARQMVLVELEGRRVGQVNGLAVVEIGDIGWALPSRISAKTFCGGSGIVNIERESELSGQIHSKATLILTGYLGWMYAQERALNMTASLTFEQNYSEIEGDSASIAELVAILSSIADVPVRQDLAVTGSMSQHGEVQPIGAANEKVEGFFDVCAQRGLTGTQGVILPARNLRELNVAPRVQRALEEGTFHIWAVDHVDDALELLTGRRPGRRRRDGSFPATSLHGRIARRLEEMAESADDKSGEEKGGDGKSGEEKSGEEKGPSSPGSQ